MQDHADHQRPLDVRRAGVLLHVTSLPGRGDLGPEAYRFVDFLAAAGCTVWQVLPLVPTQVEGSPYNAVSAMAGNPALISPRALLRSSRGGDEVRLRVVERGARRLAGAVRRVRHPARAARPRPVAGVGAGAA